MHEVFYLVNILLDQLLISCLYKNRILVDRWILIVIQIDGSYFILVNVFSFNRPDTNVT